MRFINRDRVDSVPVQRRFDTAPARMPPRRCLGALCAAPSKGLGAVRARSPRRAARLQNAFVFTLFVAWSEFRVPARAPELASLAEQKAGSHSLGLQPLLSGAPAGYQTQLSVAVLQRLLSYTLPLRALETYARAQL